MATPEIGPHLLWAKLDRDSKNRPVRWHSLLAHSADVAAVVEAILDLPIPRARLARLAGRDDLDPVTRSRLAAISFLHDIGKANRGFRARTDPKAPRVGHIAELAWLMRDPLAADLVSRLQDTLRLNSIEDWFGSGPAFHLVDVIFAHHGRPWRPTGSSSLPYWDARPGSDPIADLVPLGRAMPVFFPEAYERGLALPDAPAFHHAFAGLLMLADWIGSDTRHFPFCDGRDEGRMDEARASARNALKDIGYDGREPRSRALSRGADFRTVFKVTRPRPVQSTAVTPEAHLVVVESETGSGKTEAALWRFAKLLERGQVDGLYFALPTRVAASQIFGRVKTFRDRFFGPRGPSVVLAVPGQMRVDDAEGVPLPDFRVQWSDDADTRTRWAAEHPKRYLAAQIAVGTIDQALLGTVSSPHCHMRRSSLLRHLLVVDEVHASDIYMETLLAELLRIHVQAGGHAMLLSATLGSRMRSRLLGVPAPPLPEAEAIDYPLVSWAERGELKAEMVQRPMDDRSPRCKQVSLTAEPLIALPGAVAAIAADAAVRGAKVLVVRNTVSAAVEAQREVEALLGVASPLLFRAGGIPALHHGRYAAVDRQLLDREVERCIGKQRPDGGLIIVGTQTLEQSLDIDADLLVTDLCPVDVLLQRIGRLHRHHGRVRPAGFEQPCAIILIPEDTSLAAYLERPAHGLGSGERGGIYEDLRILELTRRLVNDFPLWRIPEMNRMLVERATHAEYVHAVQCELEAADRHWRDHAYKVQGLRDARAIQGDLATIDWSKPFADVAIEPDERFATRLGARSRLIAFDASVPGPFGLPFTGIAVPDHLQRGLAQDAQERMLSAQDGVVRFALGEAHFRYDRLGLVREDV